MENNFLELGKIVSTQGIKGEVRVEPWCDSPDFLLQFKEVYFDKGSRLIKVTSSRVMKNVVVMKLEGVDDPDAANALRGKLIYLNRNEVKLEKNQYFITDLIGMKVIDADDSSICYGELTEVSPTGANDVYHIKSGEKVYLIPAIKQVVIETDVENKLLKIRPIEGLFDDEN